MSIIASVKHIFAQPITFKVIKFLMLAAVFYWLYLSLSRNEHFSEDLLNSLYEAFSWGNLHLLIPLLLSIFLNWLMEAIKWKLLASKIEAISLWDSFKGVLAGLAMAFVSTNNIGSYFGRVWSLKSTSRHQVLGGMMLNSFSQNIVTFMMGYIGLYYWLFWKELLSAQMAIFLCCLALLISTWIVYRLFRSVSVLEKLKKYPQIYPYLEILQAYSMKEQGQILWLSLIRYFVYASQFACILLFFHVNLPWPQFVAGIMLVYLAKSSIPNFSFLTDLGIREFSAIQFLGESGFGAPNGQIIGATLTIWLINLVLPVLIGSVFILKMRLSHKE